MYYYEIHPIREILKDDIITSDEKVKSIRKIVDDFMIRANGWDLADYGIKV
jgi:hypothetical protein